MTDHKFSRTALRVIRMPERDLGDCASPNCRVAKKNAELRGENRALRTALRWVSIAGGVGLVIAAVSIAASKI